MKIMRAVTWVQYGKSDYAPGATMKMNDEEAAVLENLGAAVFVSEAPEPEDAGEEKGKKGNGKRGQDQGA